MGSTSTVPTFAVSTMPGLGTTFPVLMNGALPTSVAVLVLGTSRTMDGTNPLPRSLAFMGMTGCTQYTDIAVSVFAFVNATGNASVNITIPANPLLAGMQVPMQWVNVDTAANPFGATTSNGAEAHLR
jgi:hypothetical protein